MVDSFATLGGLFPVAGIAEVVDPPGVGAALGGAGVIDGALLVFEESAVVGFRAIEEGVLAVNEAGIFKCKSLGREVKVGGQAIEVGVGKKDVAGGSSAAFAAAGAFELESVVKPGF